MEPRLNAQNLRACEYTTTLLYDEKSHEIYCCWFRPDV